MNDFTKEELADLKDYINYAVSHSYGPTADKVDTIYNKIQSMIDNYCEHEWKLTFESSFTVSGSIIKGIYCQKCAIKLKGS